MMLMVCSYLASTVKPTTGHTHVPFATADLGSTQIYRNTESLTGGHRRFSSARMLTAISLGLIGKTIYRHI